MATGDRTKAIYGRIYRVLTKQKDFSVEKYQREEILDEMNQSQIQIFSKVLPERTFTITLVLNDADYPLLETTTNRELIDHVKAIITPTDWDYPIKIVPNKQWDEIIKTEVSASDSNQPIRGTLINNVLNLFPVPDSDFAGDILTLIANFKVPATTISFTIDPELSDVFDKDLEWLTLFSITGEFAWLELFNASINKKINLGNQSADEDWAKESEW